MIYINCKEQANRISLSVCDKICEDDPCVEHERVQESIGNYIDMFYDAKACTECGGTGITKDSYKCVWCGASAPWRF